MNIVENVIREKRPDRCTLYVEFKSVLVIYSYPFATSIDGKRVVFITYEIRAFLTVSRFFGFSVRDFKCRSEHAFVEIRFYAWFLGRTAFLFFFLNDDHHECRSHDHFAWLHGDESVRGGRAWRHLPARRVVNARRVVRAQMARTITKPCAFHVRIAVRFGRLFPSNAESDGFVRDGERVENSRRRVWTRISRTTTA